MSRKRTKTTAKPKAKKTAMKGKSSVSFKVAETMEKDFRATPAKIAAQYGKDLATLRQQEKKLLNELTKAQTKHKASKAKSAALANKANAKPQLAAAKKLTDSLNKSVTELSAKLSATKDQCKVLSQKQSKYQSLSKQLAQLEKQLDAKAKQTKPTSAKRAKKTVKQTPEKSPETHQQPTTQQSEDAPQRVVEAFEEEVNEVN